MLWTVEKSVYCRIISIVSDEISGELVINAASDKNEAQTIIYEGMYYSQLDENSAGYTVTSVVEITPDELKYPEYTQTLEQMYSDCGADDGFITDMYRRGNHFYMHHTNNGKYVVLAKRLICEKPHPYTSCRMKPIKNLKGEHQ